MEVDCTWHGVFHQPLARVWCALTSDAELGIWFDLDTRLYLEPGGEIIAPGGTQFRGLFKRGTAREIMPGKSIAWDWPLGDVETLVVWSLAEERTGTRLSVRHVARAGATALFAPRGMEDALKNFWMQDLVCLKYWLETGTSPSRSQFGLLPRESVEVILNLPIPAERAWELFTRPNELDEWVAHGSSIDLRPGGAVSLGRGQGPERVLEVEPGRRLKFNWFLEGKETFVVWSIDAGRNASSCLVRIEHSGFGPLVRDALEASHEDWLTLLHALAVYAETGEGLSSWYGPGN